MAAKSTPARRPPQLAFPLPPPQPPSQSERRRPPAPRTWRLFLVLCCDSPSVAVCSCPSLFSDGDGGAAMAPRFSAEMGEA